MTLRYGMVDGEFLIRLSGKTKNGSADLHRLARHLCRQIDLRPMPVRLDISSIEETNEHLDEFVSFLDEWTLLRLGQRPRLVCAPVSV